MSYTHVAETTTPIRKAPKLGLMINDGTGGDRGKTYVLSKDPIGGERAGKGGGGRGGRGEVP